MVMTDPALTFDRRGFLRSAGLASGAALIGLHPRLAFANAPLLKVETRTLEVNKKAATVFHIQGPGGRSGLLSKEGERLSGSVLNASTEPLQLHWHGQIKAPAEQDRARPNGGFLAPGAVDLHDFELTPGTHWMHSHTLSEQRLLAAPMVTREKDAGDVQDVVIMLHDFAFRSPQEILAELGGSNAHTASGAQATRTSGPSRHGAHSGHAGHMAGRLHANDVSYDAFLANDRTLDDPEVVRVEKAGRVRLRIINGGTATAFFISTPGLTANCVAVDGSPCQPLSAPSYPLAQGQRIDLLVSIPAQGGAFPVLAQVEQATSLTGVILATPQAAIAKLKREAAIAANMTDLSFEARLRAAAPLAAKRGDKSFSVMLGEEPGYRWTINGRIHGEHTPFDVRQGERVELTFMNPTTMMHPMHLHGHHFQVVRIGAQVLAGPIRDTVIVPAHLPVTVAFDAALKGSWFLHCHHLYHMATGMMTEINVA
jgi:FtsP/CotA-like multicopper oxidase with cupredoxin domain